VLEAPGLSHPPKAHGRVLDTGALVFVTVAAHNSSGFVLGYAMAKLAGLDAGRCRTIAIEVGMQNSDLRVRLARKHFADALVALPAALFRFSAEHHRPHGSQLLVAQPAGESSDGIRSSPAKRLSESRFGEAFHIERMLSRTSPRSSPC
jgi:hypothetical protein